LLGELRKLGIRLSRQTIARILGDAGIPPVPEDDIDTWDNFLKRHAATLFECNFCTKRMWTLRGPIDLYLLVFLHLGSRRIWITPCTAQPDSAWVAQQARNFQMMAEDAGLPAKYLVHDNDTKFTKQFDDLFESAGGEVVKTAIQAPNQQAHIERAIQTLKFEGLDGFVVVAERHLNHICRQFCAWYNGERSHGAREHLPPAWDNPPEPAVAVDPKNIVCTTRLGGFLKSYSRRAA
jgi:putative transposase